MVPQKLRETKNKPGISVFVPELSYLGLRVGFDTKQDEDAVSEHTHPVLNLLSVQNGNKCVGPSREQTESRGYPERQRKTF